MTPTLIVALILGIASYWIVKVYSEIKSNSPINNCLTYVKVNGDKILLSIIGAVLLLLNGPDLPFGAGKIDGAVPAFIAGGSIPSMINNIVGMFKKN